MGGTVRQWEQGDSRHIAGSRDSGSETRNNPVGELPYVVATMGTRVEGEVGETYITRSGRV